jgi:hypothetical protein
MDNTWEHFGTSQFKDQDKACSVLTVHICGYKNTENKGDEDGRPPTNHFCAFLQTTARDSVKVDMIPGDGEDGLTGTILLESKSYTTTNQAIKTVSFPATSGPTVGGILDLIIKGRRDKYKFTEDEEGCRYWIYVFVTDLEAAGFIGKGSGATAHAALSQYWAYPSGSTPNAMRVGTFY